jgi:hypothetical protein
VVSVSDVLTDIDPAELSDDTMPPDKKPKRTEAQKAKRREYERSRRAASGGTGRGPGRPRGKQALTSRIEALLDTLAAVWAIRDDECATVLAAQSHAIAVGLNDWAMKDPKVYRMLAKMLDGGGAGALAFALWPLAAQIGDHHLRPAIERRQQAIAEAQAQADAFDWVEATEQAVPEPAGPEPEPERFIPGNIVQD